MARSEAGSTAWNSWPKLEPSVPLKPAQRTWSRRSAPRPGPSHLLGFGHAAVDQEVGRTFGERCADPQADVTTDLFSGRPVCPGRPASRYATLLTSSSPSFRHNSVVLGAQADG